MFAFLINPFILILDFLLNIIIIHIRNPIIYMFFSSQSYFEHVMHILCITILSEDIV